MKYNINKIFKIEQIDYIYQNFIELSSQNNIFCTKDILEFFFDDLDLYTINKSDKIKSFVYLLKNKEKTIVSDPFIYSGIVNHSQSNMKLTRYNNELFKINELIVNEIISRYPSTNFNLPLNFLDTRPFLWFNYGEKNKKKFLVTPQYTSIINIKNKNKGEVFSEIDDVKKRDIKKVIQDKKYKVSNQINLNLIREFYINTMRKNKGTFDKYAFDKMINFMKTQVNKDKVIQATTFYMEKPIYSVIFLNDKKSSCYLYGSGDINIKNRYAGTLALWKAIEQTINKKLDFIDLEGINSPYRGEYKQNFGGLTKEYFNIIY